MAILKNPETDSTIEVTLFILPPSQRHVFLLRDIALGIMQHRWLRIIAQPPASLAVHRLLLQRGDRHGL